MLHADQAMAQCRRGSSGGRHPVGRGLLRGTVLLLSIPAALAAAQPPTASTPQAGQDPTFDYMSMLFVFMLATFIGFEVIRRVSRLLHTPLMSLTNAISAIAVVGAIIVAGGEHPTYINILGLIAVVASVTNIVSGFLITDRMLKMFKKREPGQQ